MWRGKSVSQPAPAKKTTKERGVDEAAIKSLFVSLAEEDDPDIIGATGIAKIAEALNIDPSSDVRILVLVWKLGSKSKPGAITESEFVTGMVTLKKESIQGLSEILPALDPGFMDKSEFREFYRFVFQFSREGTNKTIEREIVAGLLPIVLDSNRAPHVNHFVEFLPTCSQTRITFDQWDSFLPFNETVDLNLKGYKDEDAWPLLLDEYVDWRKAKK